MGWESVSPWGTDAKHSGQLSANLPPATPAGIPSNPESALFLSAQSPGLNRLYALNNYLISCSRIHCTDFLRMLFHKKGTRRTASLLSSRPFDYPEWIIQADSVLCHQPCF